MIQNSSFLKFIFLVFWILPMQSSAQAGKKIADFSLVKNRKAATILVDEQDDVVIQKAAEMLAGDIAAVTGISPEVVADIKKISGAVVIIGTIDKNRIIQKLISQNKLDVADIQGQWEAGKMVTLQNPLPKISQALVLTGSDRRGTAYSAMELSRQIGISPWIWWADVAPPTKKELTIKSGSQNFGPPAVKYRGIFLNDELWGLRQWSAKTQDSLYQDLGPHAYEKIYRLMLRLKANYFWPAKHTAFNEKPENAALADQYAIVRGGAHNAPMLGNTRKEWDEQKNGPWNYATNAENIREFWRERIERFGSYENLYTMGMRGAGDLPMGGGENVDEKVELLGQVIQDQREILKDVLQQEITQIPQAFMAYKEVLDLYDHGLDLPEDIIMVWPDDNYGYLKRLPSPKEQERPGGSGIYYHLSYLGRPHDYLWLSTKAPAHIWSELHKAYEFNARDLWVINVGDIKPAEYNFQLTMDLAWRADEFSHQEVQKHLQQFMVTCFGENIGKQATEIKQRYYHLAFSRKPEHMGWSRIEPGTEVVDTEFSFINYQEAEKRLKAYQQLQNQVEELYQQVPAAQKAAFYQLVYYPVMGASLMNKKLLVAQQNRWYARQGRSITNQLAQKVVQYHDSILLLTKQYEAWNNHKWQDMMSYDDIPFRVYKLPTLDSIEPAVQPAWNVWAEGKQGDEKNQQLPAFHNWSADTSFFEIYNQGTTPISWQAEVSLPWLGLSRLGGTLEHQQRIEVYVDWSKMEENGLHENLVKIKANDTSREIKVFAHKKKLPEEISFAEKNGVISIAASDHSAKEDKAGYTWQRVAGIGTSGSAMTTFPVTSAAIDHEWDVAENAPSLSYEFYTTSRGWFDLHSFVLPTHPINEYRDALFAVSIDDQPPIVIDFATKNRSEAWKQNVSRNAARKVSQHFIEVPGLHTFKVWLIDTGVYFDRFIFDFGGLKESYLGPVIYR